MGGGKAIDDCFGKRFSSYLDLDLDLCRDPAIHKKYSRGLFP